MKLTIFSIDEADGYAKMDFLKEIDLMKNVGHHRNLVNMLACCVRADPPLLILEFMVNGDLLKYLRKHRNQVGYVHRVRHKFHYSFSYVLLALFKDITW